MATFGAIHNTQAFFRVKNQRRNIMSNEQGKKSVKPLADILSVDLSSVNGLSAHPEQIDPEKEKKLKVISRVFNNAEDDILNGIQVIGSLMAHAGSYENYENIGVDEELLRDGGWLIKSLAETLREVLWHKDNADYALKRALEYRLENRTI